MNMDILLFGVLVIAFLIIFIAILIDIYLERRRKRHESVNSN